MQENLQFPEKHIRANINLSPQENLIEYLIPGGKGHIVYLPQYVHKIIEDRNGQINGAPNLTGQETAA